MTLSKKCNLRCFFGFHDKNELVEMPSKRVREIRCLRCRKEFDIK